MSVKETREDLAAALKPHLRKFDIFPGSIDEPTLPTLDFERAGGAPGPASRASVNEELVLYVIGPAGSTSDELADWTDEVIAALSIHVGVSWDSYRRGVFGADRDGNNGLPCYLITLHAVTNHAVITNP